MTSICMDTMILPRRPGNFIAVRKGRSISNTIFECWKYAKDHLGPESEFEEFADIHEAAKYAFGKNVVAKPASSGDDNQVAKAKQTPTFDGLSQDILNHIFSFACSREIEIDSAPCSGSISRFVPSMALVSKSLYKSCVVFVQHVPCILTLMYGSVSMEKLWNSLLFFTNNRAMLGSCTISVLQEPADRITTSIFMKVINSMDLSTVWKIDVTRTPSRLSDLYLCSLWDLVKSGIPLNVLNRAESISERSLLTELAEQLLPAKAGSLHEVEMQLDVLHFSELNIVMGCIELEYLTLHLYRSSAHRRSANISSDMESIVTLHTFIQQLPKLKVLKITSSLDHALGLRISSNTLQSLFMHESASNISLQELHCPLLRNLKVGMHLPSSLNPLVSCHRTLTDLSLRCHSTFGDINPMLGVIETMSRLKKIDLVIEVPCTLNLKSASIEDVTFCGIGAGIKLSRLECPMMKRAEVTFDDFASFDPLALQSSSTILENLTILCIDELDDRFTAANMAKLGQLNKLVQQNMPKLKTLELAIGEIEVTFMRDEDISTTDLRLGIRHGYRDVSFHTGLDCIARSHICGCDSK